MMVKIRKIFSFFIVLSSFILFSFSASAEDIDNSQNQYTIPEGTIYWESSWNMGSGNHNSVNEKNACTKMNEGGDLNVQVNGFSLMDFDGNIVKSYFDDNCESFNIPKDKNACNLMFHVAANDDAGGYRLGWVNEKDVFLADSSQYEIKQITDDDVSLFDTESEKEAEKIAETLQEEIKKDEEIPRESIILADFSGSMYSFQEDVLNRLNNMSGKKYVFSEDVIEYSPEEENWFYKIGGETDIMGSLNKIVTAGDAHIYLLTDLGDDNGTKIEQNLDYCGVITIVYYPRYTKYIVKSVYSDIANAYPNARIEGF